MNIPPSPPISTISNKLLSNPPANVKCPSYDRSELKEGILHIGVGGFHRSHQALYLDDLIEFHGIKDWAICGVGIRAKDENIYHALKNQDCLYALLEKNHRINNARIIGSLKSYLFGYQDPEPVFKKLADPDIKIVTITATEAGYYLNQGTGELKLRSTAIQNDLGYSGRPQTIFGYLAEGLERRFKKGIAPFTILSCDNIQNNGHVVKKALITFCGKRNEKLAKWIEQQVSFPNCMVDRITPATTEAEQKFIRKIYHLDDAFPVIAEPFKQWIIEDQFCNDRPPLEKVGVQFTSHVAPYEKMKIRLLNGAHSAMGYLGYLCGHKYIYEIARVTEFSEYLKQLMDLEIMPLIGSVPGMNLTEYKNTLMERFTNEAIKDKALRICADGSAKIPIFILPSILEQLERGGPIDRLTLCVASWIRFLDGKDEQGKDILIRDPQAEKLISLVKNSKNDPMPLLRVSEIFGDLSHSEIFVKKLKNILNSLYANGPLATLRNCIENKNSFAS